jgi:queuosine precursor transporter
VKRSTLAVILFIAAMAVANLLVAWFGPWISPINAFVFVGLSMVTRDIVHDAWWESGRFVPRMGAMIATAGLIAWAVDASAGRIAVASATALVGSAAVETATFQGLIRRTWLVRSNGSNVPGAAVDTVVFVTVAFGLSWELAAVMALQFTAKVAGGAVWSVVLLPFRPADAAAAHQS